MDKKSLSWHSRVENMCQWHPSQTPWERKWEAKRENNWKMRYCAGRARCGRGRAPLPTPNPALPISSAPTRLFITTQSNMDVDVTRQLLKSALCWCPLPWPTLPPSLAPSLPPAHPDVIKEFSSCLFALGCSCSPCFTPDHVYMCVCTRMRTNLCTHPG